MHPMFAWAYPSPHPNGISIGSAIFAGLTAATDWQTNWPTDRQTNRPCYSICNNRPNLHGTAMGPKSTL